MAYTDQQLIKKALNAIKKHNCVFITQVAHTMGISRTIFYNRGLDKVDIILEALESNKIKKKLLLQNKWFESENPTLQQKLYSLIADDEELERLHYNKQQHEIKQETLNLNVEIENHEKWQEWTRLINKS